MFSEGVAMCSLRAWLCDLRCSRRQIDLETLLRASRVNSGKGQNRRRREDKKNREVSNKSEGGGSSEEMENAMVRLGRSEVS